MYLETERLRTEHMQSLLNGDLLAIRLSQFIDAPTSQKLGTQIIDKGFDRYVNAPSIGRIGMAFYEAENQPERMASYFEGVFDNIDELRRRCAPYLSPIDVLRCTLDEVWPAGATLETLYGKKCMWAYRAWCNRTSISWRITIFWRKTPRVIIRPSACKASWLPMCI